MTTILATSALQELRATTTVADALECLYATHARAAVVVDGDRPLGVVTLAGLRGDVRRVPRPEACVADVMEFELVRVDPAADEHATLRAYANAGWSSLRRRRPATAETRERHARVYAPAAPTANASGGMEDEC
jgi:predicted transcriptional regulator